MSLLATLILPKCSISLKNSSLPCLLFKSADRTSCRLHLLSTSTTLSTLQSTLLILSQPPWFLPIRSTSPSSSLVVHTVLISSSVLVLPVVVQLSEPLSNIPSPSKATKSSMVFLPLMLSPILSLEVSDTSSPLRLQLSL